MSESQKPLQILDIFNTENFITNKDFVTYKAQGIVTVPNGLKFGDGSYLNGDFYSVNGTLVLDVGTDGTDATFNGDVNGDVYGDIYNPNNLSKILDSDAGTFTGDVTGNLYGDIYNSSNQQVFDAGDGTVNNPATFLTAVNFTNAVNFTGTMLINSTLNLTNNTSDMAFDFTSDTDTGIRYNSADSFNLVAGNNNVINVASNRVTISKDLNISSYLYFDTYTTTTGYEAHHIKDADDATRLSFYSPSAGVLPGRNYYYGDTHIFRTLTGTSANAYLQAGRTVIEDILNQEDTTAALTVIKDDSGDENMVEVLRLERKCGYIDADSSTPPNTEGGYIGLYVTQTGLNQTNEFARISWRPSNDDLNPAIPNDGRLAFWTDDNGTITERMTITDQGYVGLSNTTPTCALDVTGDIKGSNDLDVAGAINATTITGSFTGALTGNADTATKIATINNNNIVQTSGDQSIGGTKTFTSNCLFTGNVITTQNQPFSVNYSTNFTGGTSSGPTFTFSSGIDQRACVMFRITAQVASEEINEVLNNVSYNYMENTCYVTNILTCYPGRFPTGTWAPSTSNQLFYAGVGSGGDTTFLNNTPWTYFSAHGQRALFGIKKKFQEGTFAADQVLTLTGINTTIQFICQKHNNQETSYQITVEVLNVNDYWGANDTITYYDTLIGIHNRMPIVIG